MALNEETKPNQRINPEMKIAGLIQFSRYDGKRSIKEKEKPSYVKTELTDFITMTKHFTNNICMYICVCVCVCANTSLSFHLWVK